MQTTRGPTQMPSDAKVTAEAVLFFDKLVDAMNGPSSTEKGHPARSLITDTSHHIQFLREAKAKLSKMRFVDKITRQAENRSPCLKTGLRR